MLVSVTGAAGHIGANLVRELLRRGHTVRALVRQRTAALEGLAVERVAGDVLEPESLLALVDGAEIVVHLAAVVSITGDQGGRVTAVNELGTANVAQAALRAGVRRMLHCSSVHAFDLASGKATGRGDSPLDESWPRALGERHSAYDRSKARAEQALGASVAAGLDVVIVSPTAVIGPFDYGPSHMGAALLGMRRRTLPALVHGGFDWVDVRDVVAGALAAVDRGRTGENYLLSGSFASIQELASMSAEITGVRPPRWTAPLWLARVGAPVLQGWASLTGATPLYTKESLEVLSTGRRVSHDKATRELGYRARPLVETLRDTYEWFDEVGRSSPDRG